MKNQIILYFFCLTIAFQAKCQNNKSIETVDLNIFFDTELKNFDNIENNKASDIIKINDVKSYQNELTSTLKNNLPDISQLDWYNIEKRLLIPFKRKEITIDDFNNFIDGLDIKLAEFIPLYFQMYKCDQLAESDKLLNKVLNLSQNYNQTKGFLIRATQRPNQFKKEIIDSLHSDSFYNSSHPEVDVLLSRFASLGNDKETIELLEYAINQLPEQTRIRWNPPGDNINVFDHLLNNSSEDLKNQTLQLIYRFLNKAASSAALQFYDILSQQISEEIKHLLDSKLQKLQELKDSESYAKEEKLFYENYLSHYARNYRTNSIQLIEKALIPDSTKIEYDDRQRHFRIKDYQDEVIIRNGIGALISLSNLEDLTESEKSDIYACLEKSNILKLKGYYWREAIKVIQNLYPNKKYNDYLNFFFNVPESNRYMSIEEYWNRPIYSIQEYHNYLEFFSTIGIDTTKTDNIKYHKFLKNYRNDDRVTVIWGLLDLLEISLNYDCETGVWPNPYDELLNQYLNRSKELSDFYPIFFYEKINDELNTKYTTIISNGISGYKTNPKDFGDWFDPNTIEAMLNYCLAELGIDKRFIQLQTGDQTILSVYAKPGQVKKIAEKFNMKLVNEF